MFKNFVFIFMQNLLLIFLPASQPPTTRDDSTSVEWMLVVFVTEDLIAIGKKNVLTDRDDNS